MFEDLVFNKNKDEFNKFIQIKGKYMHKQFYDVLKSKNDKVLYSDISSCIRYDKRLRDTLYVYLATFEEYFKAHILNNYDLKQDITPLNEDRNKHFNELKENFIKIQEKDNHDNSLLYYNFDLDLGQIIELLKDNKLLNLEQESNLKLIKDLRNNVMHHSVLILGKSKTIKEMENNKIEIIKEINALANYLPKDYRQNFIKDVNKLKCDREDYKIKIGE